MRINRKFKIGALIVFAAVCVVGAMIAETVTKPMDVDLQTSIQVCKKSDKGWEVIDQLGPANLKFEASMIDMAMGKQFDSKFKWSTMSKNGVEYSARLSQPVTMSFDPMTGKMEGDVKFDCTWNKMAGKIMGHLTTDSVSGPLGAVNGKRAKGMMGSDPMTLTLVSANDLTFPGNKDAMPLKLVCTETYTLTPKKK